MTSQILLFAILGTVVGAADYEPFNLRQFFMTFYNPRMLNLPPLSRGRRELEAQTVCKIPDAGFEILENMRINAPRCVVKEFPYLNTINECIVECQKEATLCHSVEITEGVCTLYSISFDDAPEKFEWSQIKGLHVVAQRRCATPTCSSLWQTELVPSYRLNNHIFETVTQVTRSECTDRCLTNSRCKSANYNTFTSTCQLNKESRQSLATTTNDCAIDYESYYIENNCIVDPSQVCTFEEHESLIPYSFNAFYLNARTENECKARCTSDLQGCRSYTFGLFANIPMCFLTHQTNTEFIGRGESFCQLANVSTHELKSCYNFQTQCVEDGFSIKFESSRKFNGVVYPPQSPNCRIEVENANEFFFVIPYGDPLCNITVGPSGFYETEMQIQHKRNQVTSPDFIMNAVFDCITSSTLPSESLITTTQETTTLAETTLDPREPPTTTDAQSNPPWTTEMQTTLPTTEYPTTTELQSTITESLTTTDSQTTIKDMTTTEPTTITDSPTTTESITDETTEPTTEQQSTTPTESETEPSTTYPPTTTLSPEVCPEPQIPEPIYIYQNATCPTQECPTCKPQGPPQLGITVLYRNGTQLSEDPKIGDPVALAFFVSDIETPFEPRITDVAAVNVHDDSVFQMLDKRGCPSPPYTASKIYKFAQGLYFSDFDAFTFNQLDTIRYRAQVEWCWEKCSPPICDDNEQLLLANANDHYIESFQGNTL